MQLHISDIHRHFCDLSSPNIKFAIDRFWADYERLTQRLLASMGHRATEANHVVVQTELKRFCSCGFAATDAAVRKFVNDELRIAAEVFVLDLERRGATLFWKEASR